MIHVHTTQAGHVFYSVGLQPHTDAEIAQAEHASQLMFGRGPDQPRNPEFEPQARKYIEAHPTCLRCGGSRLLQLHHKFPFHLYPHLEMNQEYWRVLCMATPVCHLAGGHLLDFSAWNPHVDEDCAKFHAAMTARPYKALPNTP